MKQVQKLSDHDIFKIGFGFDKYIRWEYLKTIINSLITSKINETPAPTLQEVTDSGSITTNDISANLVTVTEGLQLPNNMLQDIGVAGSEPITPDSCLLFTINGTTYKIQAQTQL